MEQSKSKLIEFLTGDGKSAHPPHFGVRFDEAGNFLPEPGNTVVAHVKKGSQSEQRLVELRDEMMALPGSDHFAFTPVSSYHMTVFQGVLEFRRKPDFWPPECALDAPIAATTEHLMGKLQNWEKSPDYEIRPIEVTPLGLTVAGLTDDDETKLRSMRNRLADAFGYRHPSHETYAFHITMAYLIRHMDEAVAEDYAAGLSEIGEAFMKKVPSVELGTSDFCTFEDMKHFEPVRCDL